MARVFALVEDEAGRQTGRGSSFAAVLAYVLRDAGPSTWRGSIRLSLPLTDAAIEMEHVHRTTHLNAKRSGPRTRRPVLHAVLGWLPSDYAWLTRDHVAETVQAALRVLGLEAHQAVWVTHTDTGRPHVHIVANLIHPVTGQVARLGLVKKRMSGFCRAYEERLGDVRCHKRFAAKAANENRARLPRSRKVSNKQKASFAPASRP